MYASLRMSRGVVLREIAGRFDALFHYATGGTAPVARPTLASVAGGLALVALAACAVLALVALALGADPLTGALLATAPALVTRNREANELRAQADKVVEEIRDTSKPLTADELAQKMDAVKTLKARADFLEEISPDQEIARQGGAGDLTRIDVGDKERTEFESVRDVTDRVRQEAVKGFRNFGEFLRVMRGKQEPTSAQVATVRKMQELSRAITGAGSAEVLLPLQQEASIFSVSNQQDGILPRARRYSVTGRSLRIPMLVQDEGSNTLNRPMAGKIANVTFVDEAAEKPARDPVFTQRLIEVKKAAAITEFGDEILEDDFTGMLPQQVTESVGGQVMNFFNEQFTVDGSTVVASGGPLGALNAANGALLTVDRDTANQVKADDVFGMYARHTHGPNSVWFASRYLMQSLMQLTLNGTSLVTWLTNLRDKPVMLLLGYPVVITDLVPTLGTAGDLSLVNPDFYAVAMRQGLTVQSSIHEKFRYDITVYRFLARAGGVPIPASTYAYKFQGGAKVDEHSPFVRLGLPTSS